MKELKIYKKRCFLFCQKNINIGKKHMIYMFGYRETDTIFINIELIQRLQGPSPSSRICKHALRLLIQLSKEEYGKG